MGPSSRKRHQYGTTTKGTLSKEKGSFNYLFNQQFSPELLAKIVGHVIKHPSNEIFLMWSEIIAAYFEKQICGQVYFQGGWKQEEQSNNTDWSTIQKLIQNPNSYLILHTTGHFIPIMGFASYPYYTQSMEKNKNRWLFLAETCPWHHLGAIQQLHMSLSPPIICIRWEAVRKMLNGVICLSRHRSCSCGAWGEVTLLRQRIFLG